MPIDSTGPSSLSPPETAHGPDPERSDERGSDESWWHEDSTRADNCEFFRNIDAEHRAINGGLFGYAISQARHPHWRSVRFNGRMSP